MSYGPQWRTRPEKPSDVTAIRDVNLAAFETAHEADLVDALRQDPAWINGLSIVTTNESGVVVGHALLTRCYIGDVPALCLGPCAVLPDYQRNGVGSAAIWAGLKAARDHGEDFVVVLGHPSYYPKFGFERASNYGIQVSVDVPDEALMALSLSEDHRLPAGTVRYAAPFGM